MSWRREWDSLSARIVGLLDAGRFYIETLGLNREDPQRVGDKLLLPECDSIFNTLKEFRERNGPVLPDGAAGALDRLLTDARGRYERAQGVDRKKHFGVQAGVTALAVFRAEFEYLIRDASVIARRQSERAFQHLQRSIVADPSVRAAWETAFTTKGEVECERLGAAHLLLHGIWAFKVNATGERTDLVFPERSVVDDEVARVADALVLTEWKRVGQPGDLTSKIADLGSKQIGISAAPWAGLNSRLTATSCSSPAISS
jgi:hypothetical protein